LSDAHPELTQSLGYRFRDPALLERALTHRSKSIDNNERLEFLGDSVLNFSIAATLYERFPQLTEGELTRLRAGLVRMETLAGLARRLRLGGFLGLGGGELKSGGHDRDSILADALEAVFGAVYQDAGFDMAHRVIQGLYREALDRIDPQSVLKDPKTRLQEYLQKQSISTPSYNVLEIAGEPHQQRFIVECSVPGLPRPVRGEGLSRRAAEQQAAALALEALLKRDA
jgi:ribonuclease III